MSKRQRGNFQTINCNATNLKKLFNHLIFYILPNPFLFIHDDTLDATKADAIVDAIELYKLEHVGFWDIDFKSHLIPVCEALARSTTLERLELVHIDKKGVVPLDCILQSQTLQVLKLTDLKLTCSMPFTRPPAPLTSLALKGCATVQSDFSMLGFLKQFRLNKLVFTEGGLLSTKPTQDIVAYVEHNTDLQILDLSLTKLASPQAHSFVQAVAKGNSVQVLSLLGNDNWSRKQSFIDLIRDARSVVDLNLSQCKLEGAIYGVIDALADNTTLCSLNLSDNDTHNHDMTLIDVALARNKTLTKLVILEMDMKRPFGVTIVEKICAAFPTNNTLVNVQIGGSSFAYPIKEAMEKFALVLEGNSALQQLMLWTTTGPKVLELEQTIINRHNQRQRTITLTSMVLKRFQEMGKRHTRD